MDLYCTSHTVVDRVCFLDILIVEASRIVGLI